MNRLFLVLLFAIVLPGCASVYNLPTNPTSWQSCIPDTNYLSEGATEEALVCLDTFYRAELTKVGKEPIRAPSKKQCDEYRVLGETAYPYCGFLQRLAYNRRGYPHVDRLLAHKKAGVQARKEAARNASIEAEVRRWMALTPGEKEAEIYRKQLLAAERAKQDRKRQLQLCYSRAFSAPTKTGHFSESLENVAKCNEDPSYDALEEAKSRCGYKTVTGQYNMVDHGRLGAWTERLYVCD